MWLLWRVIIRRLSISNSQISGLKCRSTARTSCAGVQGALSPERGFFDRLPLYIFQNLFLWDFDWMEYKSDCVHLHPAPQKKTIPRLLLKSLPPNYFPVDALGKQYVCEIHRLLLIPQWVNLWEDRNIFTSV